MTSSLCQRWSGLLTFSGAWESQSVFLLLLGTAVAVEHLLHDVVWSCYLKVFDYLRFYGTMFLCVAAMNQISPISCSVQSIADPIRGLLRDPPPPPFPRSSLLGADIRALGRSARWRARLTSSSREDRGARKFQIRELWRTPLCVLRESLNVNISVLK